jgi:hypothetical protein
MAEKRDATGHVLVKGRVPEHFVGEIQTSSAFPPEPTASPTVAPSMPPTSKPTNTPRRRRGRKSPTDDVAVAVAVADHAIITAGGDVAANAAGRAGGAAAAAAAAAAAVSYVLPAKDVSKGLEREEMGRSAAYGTPPLWFSGPASDWTSGAAQRSWHSEYVRKTVRALTVRTLAVCCAR